MKIIRHRANSIAELKATEPVYGVEIDLHSYQTEIVVHHDPMQPGVPFEYWLQHFKHDFLIANIKQEGIEVRVLEILKKNSVHDFFLLDVSFPSLIRMTQNGIRQLAVRLSSFEPIQTSITLAGQLDWIWVDLFDERLPLSAEEWQNLKKLGYKLCIVSPELHGRSTESIRELKAQLSKLHITPDAVCTKQPSLWE